MLAVKPARGAHDVAPTWLVSESSLYSTAEWKRKERARGQQKGGGKTKDTKGGGKGKGDKAKRGKGDGRKGGGGHGAAAHVQG